MNLSRTPLQAVAAIILLQVNMAFAVEPPVVRAGGASARFRGPIHFDGHADSTGVSRGDSVGWRHDCDTAQPGRTHAAGAAPERNSAKAFSR